MRRLGLCSRLTFLVHYDACPKKPRCCWLPHKICSSYVMVQRFTGIVVSIIRSSSSIKMCGLGCWNWECQWLISQHDATMPKLHREFCNSDCVTMSPQHSAYFRFYTGQHDPTWPLIKKTLNTFVIDWLCIVFIVWFICRGLLTHNVHNVVMPPV